MSKDEIEELREKIYEKLEYIPQPPGNKSSVSVGEDRKKLLYCDQETIIL